MKTFAAVLASAALVAAQSIPSSIPSCGVMCINNMIQIASTEFGCSAGNSTCYCGDPRFGYGLNDCALEACGASVQAQVVSFGESYCSSAGTPATSGAASVLSSVSGTVTGAGGASSTPFTTSAVVSGSSTIGSTTLFTAAGASSTPFTTSAVVSGSSTIGSTTLYTVVGGASGASSSASAAAGNASSSASSVASKASSEASSVASSASSAASKAGGSSTGSSSGGATSASSSGIGAIMTAAPIVAGGAFAAIFLGL